MAAFAYRAVSEDGRASKGIIEAASASAARQALRGRRLLPVSVEPTAAQPGSTNTVSRSTIGVRALTIVTRQLATLIGSGITVEEALKTVADQTRAPKVSSLLLNLRAAVLDGRSFAAALGDYPSTFAEYYRASVAAGESSGKLGQVMEHLSGFVETKARNRQTIVLALLYPAILALVSLAVIVALLTFVVPDIVRVFTARGAELPLLTQILIAISDFLNEWGLSLIAGIAGLVVCALWLLRRSAIRLRWHKSLAVFPMSRSLVLKASSAQFSGTLATLIVSRVPLTDALAAAAQTVPNLHVRAAVEEASARVREGASLSVSLQEAQVFSPMLVAMVASGEAGGVLGATLTRAADEQTRDLNAIVAAVVALVEPAVLLVMGGVVMLLVLSILLPIVNLNNLVG